MNTLNLNQITKEVFETIIKNLIGTNCKMEFTNHTDKHEEIALSLGLTVCVGETLEVFCEADHVGNYY